MVHKIWSLTDGRAWKMGDTAVWTQDSYPSSLHFTLSHRASANEMTSGSGLNLWSSDGLSQRKSAHLCWQYDAYKSATSKDYRPAACAVEIVRLCNTVASLHGSHARYIEATLMESFGSLWSFLSYVLQLAQPSCTFVVTWSDPFCRSTDRISQCATTSTRTQRIPKILRIKGTNSQK